MFTYFRTSFCSNGSFHASLRGYQITRQLKSQVEATTVTDAHEGQVPRQPGCPLIDQGHDVMQKQQRLLASRQAGAPQKTAIQPFWITGGRTWQCSLGASLQATRLCCTGLARPCSGNASRYPCFPCLLLHGVAPALANEAHHYMAAFVVYASGWV